MYLLHHPIQYQAPLLRRLSSVPGLDLRVCYLSDLTVKGYNDRQFGRMIEWDTPLLGGYHHEFLRSIGSKEKISFWNPVAYGFSNLLRQERVNALWVHGYAQLSLVLAILIAKSRDIPILFRAESNLVSVSTSPAKQALKSIWLRWLFSNCDGMLCIGSLNREYYRHYGVAEAKLFFMPYAVDNAFFQERIAKAQLRRAKLRRTLGLHVGRPVILYASKLVGRKRPHDLLEAYARLSPDGRTEPEAYLLFVGDGEQRQALEKRKQELGWDSIKFLGFQNQTKLPVFYDLCDLFVLPSFGEPWGLVINEVMNAAKAVVVSDQVGAGVDLITQGENGWWFPAGNVAALERCLRDALSDPRRLVEMGRASLKRINCWSFEEDVEGLMGALHTVL